MKTISILGSGWLGLPLAEHLHKQSYRVKASTRSIQRLEAIRDTGAEAFIVDITQPAGNIGVFLEADILIVNITSKDITAFESLIDDIETSAVSRVIFVSSTSVYTNTNGLVSEADGAEIDDHPLLKIENHFHSGRNFLTTVVRFAGLIGYDRHPSRFFANRPISQPEAPVNLIHRDDCIEILCRIIERDLFSETFNACTDTHPSKADFYRYACQARGMDEPEVAESGDAEFKIVDNSKLKSTLDYAFIHADLMALDL